MSTKPLPSGWISFADRMPEPQYDPKNPGSPTHPYILVTNNLAARDRWGHMSHVWLVGMVHAHEQDHVFRGELRAEAGEITAFAQPGVLPLRNLTHWRPAVPEDWVSRVEMSGEPDLRRRQLRSAVVACVRPLLAFGWAVPNVEGREPTDAEVAVALDQLAILCRLSQIEHFRALVEEAKRSGPLQVTGDLRVPGLPPLVPVEVDEVPAEVQAAIEALESEPEGAAS